MVNQVSNQPTLTNLRRVLTRPLPGLAAQLRMAPACLAETLRNRATPPAPKQAGVLILLYPQDGQLYFPLTRRTDTVENHKGQISLPGGAREVGESLRATAWRETREELRIGPENWRLLGSLTPLYIPPSGFLIRPFIAYAPARPPFEPDPIEVAELIETPLALLLDPTTVAREEWEIHSTMVEVPFFHIHGHKVWGATAMVLSELVALLRTEARG